MRCTTISSTLCSSGEGLHVPERSRPGGFPTFTEASVLWGNQLPVCSLLVLKIQVCLIVIKLSGYGCLWQVFLSMKYNDNISG